MNSKDIRKAFFSFFMSKKHNIENSAAMVVKNDPTLMFTNAGMNQFKDIFLDFEIPKNKRVANSQKCLRVSGKHNDLEEVGVDTYHHTMFEMLGNWSFGDYFKKEAIEWSWELFTEVYNIDKNRLYVTVFEGDKKDGTQLDLESYKIWEKLVSKNQILNFGKKDNFWEMGGQGPCGPSSEIHIDLRNEEEILKTPGKDLVNQDHPQVVELWNLVFIEFNRNSRGLLTSLNKKHVDTGMGLERLAMVLQNKTSNYDTDIFKPLIENLEQISQKKYMSGSKSKKQETLNIAFRVIVDHLRAVSFSITDGQLPSNSGAGYVIRRILRRAIRYGYQFLDFREPFIYSLVPKLANNFSGVFDELKKNQEFITKIIQEEEISFFRTLSDGIKKMQEIVINQSKNKDQVISGKLAFELYDRYGFPLDLTQLIASENNLKIDIEEFHESLADQQKKSKIDAVKDYGDWITIKEDDVQEFIGYDHLEAKISITKYRSIINKGKEAFQLIFNLTPFYPEGGGQVGDTGQIENNIEKLSIKDTKKENGVIVHFVDRLPKNLKGSFRAKVNVERRNKISKNHSATHLLHDALRTVLGKHVEQKGSLVNEYYLRFDFSHFSKLSKEELVAVENLVKEKIREANPLVEERDTPLETAKKRGAMMLFGEKYADSVRVIQFGNSIELCGGIHVPNSAHIGNFIIKSESSISSGIRRIEAVSSNEADQITYNKVETYDAISKILKTQDNLSDAVEQLVIKNSELQKELDSFNQEKLKKLKSQLISNLDKSNSFSFIEYQSDLSAEQMKQIAFEIKGELSNFILLLTSNLNNKPIITLMISENLVQSKAWNAGSIIRDLSIEIKGGGGGQPFFATAGGSYADGLKKVIQKAKEIFKD
ncbi:MAG: alanine--tRNA ligase [Bacteroidetes bacterium MED-G20]|nr:MAG: alanine--tRNA ligase [Bacteroidetes bacterium MED-G20]